MYEIPKLYYFNPKTGAVDKKKTSLYRKYAATSTLAKQNNASKIKKVLGKYKKCTISKGNTCMLDGNGSITGGSIMYDGKDLGVVPSAHAVELAVAEVEGITRETLHDSSYQVDQSLLQTETGVFLRKEITSEEELRNELTDELGLVEYAYVLYVDGEKVVATTFPDALDDILAQLKLGYQTEDTVDAYFVEDVEIRQEYVDTSYIMNLGYIAEILNETKEGEVTYTVQSGDSYYSIADEYGLSVDALMKLNPGYDPKILRTGDVLTISNAVPYLTVVNVERQRYVQDVPYPVEYTDDASMYQGEYKVTLPGVYGKADVTANVTYINGTETEREIVASVTLSQPVTQLALRGTKERPSWYPTGSFGWPCNGVITSYFGPRNTGIRGASTYHEAIDIANSYGTPIYASDGGTVIYSGWQGGYGYLVKIDHGNGYVTYYGHNSSLLVSVGEHVHKGQQIARMGSTGISSGNHCDFRIQLNGTVWSAVCTSTVCLSRRVRSPARTVRRISVTEASMRSSAIVKPAYSSGASARSFRPVSAI